MFNPMGWDDGGLSEGSDTLPLTESGEGIFERGENAVSMTSESLPGFKRAGICVSYFTENLYNIRIWQNIPS